jgi:hypothetical protein
MTSSKPKLFHCKGSILSQCRLHTCLAPTVRDLSVSVNLRSLISVYSVAILAIGGTDRNVQIWVRSEILVCH